jgi:hypothetical protein
MPQHPATALGCRTLSIFKGCGLDPSFTHSSTFATHTSLRPHDFLVPRHRRPRALSIIRPQWPHPIRTLPSPRMRRRTNIRMRIVTKSTCPPRRPFRQRPIPRAQICATTNVSPRENGIHHEPNQDQHKRPDHVARRITIKKSRRSLWSRRSPPSSSVFMFQGFSVEESSFRLVEPSMEPPSEPSSVPSSSLRAS